MKVQILLEEPWAHPHNRGHDFLMDILMLGASRCSDMCIVSAAFPGQIDFFATN